MKLQNIVEEYAIYGMLFSLSNRIQTLGDKEFTEITLKQQFLLTSLQMFSQPPTLKETGELIGCSYQNVKRMAEQLQKLDYLVIQQDPKDRRKLLLVATDKVKQWEVENMSVIENFMDTLYKSIPREDLVTTLMTLKKMDQNIGGLIE